MESTTARRPLKTRQTRWAGATARFLAVRGVRPNTISVLSVLFAVGSGLAYYFSSGSELAQRGVLLLAGAAGIQLRLLCNMLDGMIAVEGGMKTKTGEIYNDFPDRLADSAILIGAGYAITRFGWGSTLGWFCALAAMMTAYVRLLGGSMGLVQQFIGPMAKQHRMFTLTLGTVVELFLGRTAYRDYALTAALVIIAAGSVWTSIRRVTRIAGEVNRR